MRVAISNIAWQPQDDEHVARLMAQHGVDALEVAPTVCWPDPTVVSDREVVAYRKSWEARDVEIVAMQSLLYGHPELVIFGSDATREATLEYLDVMYRIAGWLGATRLVFGSPANRRAGDMPVEERTRIAVDFFHRAGEAAGRHGVQLCIEPNPPQYGCDFINTIEEGRALVAAVDSSGFGLHLDAGGMEMQGEGKDAIARAGVPAHFHVSEPFLAPLNPATAHDEFADALRRLGYTGICSIEARRPSDAPPLAAIQSNLSFAMRTYGAFEGRA